jgi:hypothetical protein
MKKITISVIALFSFLVTSSFAATNVTVKNEAATPHYNSGFGFGLAGYYTQQESTKITESAKPIAKTENSPASA